jgi:hypothetical protein
MMVVWDCMNLVKNETIHFIYEISLPSWLDYSELGIRQYKYTERLAHAKLRESVYLFLRWVSRFNDHQVVLLVNPSSIILAEFWPFLEFLECSAPSFDIHPWTHYTNLLRPEEIYMQAQSSKSFPQSHVVCKTLAIQLLKFATQNFKCLKLVSV